MNRVSVVIPTFNRDWCILRALDSVLAQTFLDLDIWVVDDEWLPDKLQRQIDCLELHPEAALVHGGESWIRNGKPVQVPEVYRKYGGDVYERCLPVCMIGPSTVVVKREALVEVGAFDESFPVCEDYYLWLRIASRWPAPREDPA